MAHLAGAELLELEDQQTKDIRVSAWELGEMTIQQKGTSWTKNVRTLRLRVPVADKPIGPAYWDVTSQTLIEQLLPFLKRPDYQRIIFSVTKHGVAPTARFQVAVAQS